MKFHEECENLKMLRETADSFGLTKLLARALRSDNPRKARRRLRKALRLLGWTP